MDQQNTPIAELFAQEANRHALVKAARDLVAANDTGTADAYFVAVAGMLAAAQAMAAQGQGTRPWPKQKDVGRYGDMHPPCGSASTRTATSTSVSGATKVPTSSSACQGQAVASRRAPERRWSL